MAEQKNLEPQRLKELAGELCYILLPKEIGINDAVIKRVGWGKRLYLGGSDTPGENELRRPKAAQAIQDFMGNNDLTVDELFEVLLEIENSWETVSTY